MEEIIEYYKELIMYIYEFVASIVEGVISCVDGSGDGVTPFIIVSALWLVLTVIVLVWAFFAADSLPVTTWAVIILMVPIVGAIAFIITDKVYKARKRQVLLNPWNRDAHIVNKYLVKWPVGCALAVFVVAILLKIMNMDTSMIEILGLSCIVGLIVLVIMIPIAFCKLRESESLVYMGDGAVVTKSEQLDTQLINVVSRARRTRPESNKPIISQDDLEEDTEHSGDEKTYTEYTESQLKGLFLKDEQKVQHVSDAIYHVEYLDVDGQRSSFAVKGRSNVGTLLIALNTVCILCVFFTPFILFAIKVVEEALSFFA